MRFPPPMHICPEIQKSLRKDPFRYFVPPFPSAVRPLQAAIRTPTHQAGPLLCGWTTADKLANLSRVRRLKENSSAFFTNIWTITQWMTLTKAARNVLQISARLSHGLIRASDHISSSFWEGGNYSYGEFVQSAKLPSTQGLALRKLRFIQ